MFYVIALALVAVIMAPLFVTYHNMKQGKKTPHAKRAILFNLAAFAVVCLTAIVLPLGGYVHAADANNAASGLATGLGYLGAGLSTGLACIGAGVGVGHGAAAAIGAVTEDPKVFGRAMIFVVLGEGIAIYGLIISFMIVGRL
ncbi:MAG TPA: ATPase [Ruminococcaceae bacterium]|nr:ATPase [Oscillospiraceae bacterium]